MCHVDVVEKTNRVRLPASATRNAGRKRPITLALHEHDPAAAAAEQPAKRMPPAANSSATGAGAMVLYAAPAANLPAAEAEAEAEAEAGALVSYVAPAIDAVPLAMWPGNAGASVSYVAAAPPKGIEHMSAPSWIHEVLLPQLKLRGDLPVIFVDEKVVTKTDLDPHQNRFRLPNDGVLRRLRSILTHDQVAKARLLDEQGRRAGRVPSPSPTPPSPPEERNAVAAAGAGLHEGQHQQGKERKTGEKHDGLPVWVVNNNLVMKKLQLARWKSSDGSVIKGAGYADFINQCGFEVNDLVEVWAFKQCAFWNFGVKMCDESPLYMVMVKEDGERRH